MYNQPETLGPITDYQLASIAAATSARKSRPGAMDFAKVDSEIRGGLKNEKVRLSGAWKNRQWFEGNIKPFLSAMAMELGLDSGPVLLERSLAIGLLENAGQLAERLSGLTAELLLEALPLIEAAGPGPQQERLTRLGLQPQPSEGLTLARLLNKDDYLVDWQQSALAIHRRVMGLYPGAHCQWRGKRLKLLATEPLVQRLAAQLSGEAAALSERSWPKAEPGSVLERVKGVGLVLATGGCPLLLRTAQLEGKAPARGNELLQQLS